MLHCVNYDESYINSYYIPISEEINFWIEGLLRYTKNSVERSKEAVDNFFKGKYLCNNWNNIENFHTYVHSAQFDNL